MANDETTLTAAAEKPKQNVIPLDRVRWKLASLWLLMGGGFLLLLIVQSIMGKYDQKVQRVWSWALPSIMPTLSLIVTVLGMNAYESEDEAAAEIRRPFYRAVFWVSVIYLSILIGTILVEPFTPYESLELLNLSNFWLAPLQAFVASTIAVLFLSKHPRVS